MKVSVNSLCLCVCTCVHINQHDSATNSVGRCGSMADWLAVINLQPQWESRAASLPQENITCCHTNTPQSSLRIYHKQRMIHRLTCDCLMWSNAIRCMDLCSFNPSPLEILMSLIFLKITTQFISLISTIWETTLSSSVGMVTVKLQQKYIPQGLIQGIMHSLRPVASIY